MPRFLDPSNPSLNGLVRVKKVVNSLNKKRFANLERSVNTAPVQDTLALYDALTKKLSDINASIFEVVTTIQLTVNTSRSGAKQGLSQIGDRFVGATSTLIRQTQDIVAFTNLKLKNTLNMFSPQQIEEIAQIFATCQHNEEMLTDQLDGMARVPRLADVMDALTDLSESWSIQFGEWADKFSQMLSSYKYGLSGVAGDSNDFSTVSTASSGAGRHGGAVALREGLDFAPTFATANRYPPRNTHDREYLPRRFL
jgi:hypothetical protein